MPNYTKAKRIARKKRNVLFISSEVSPFTSGSDLADITNGLPLALEELGNEMRIMMPKYGSINDRVYRVHDVIRLSGLEIPFGKTTKTLNVKVTALPASKTQTYFLYNEELFKRPGIYADPVSHKEFLDNDKRFIFFSRGVFETLKALGWKPDIIHCNGWISGLTLAYLNLVYKNDPFFANTKSVFTIHNIDEQGIFKKKSLVHANLSEKDLKMGKNGTFNFTHLGILFADVITTLSETYANEISSPKIGGSLATLIKKTKKKLIGIPNGINAFSWNPVKDKNLKKRFSYKNVSLAKKDNKIGLYPELGFSSIETEEPLLVIISELKNRKGLELVLKVFPKLIKQDIKMIVVGSGDKKYETFFKTAQKKHRHKLCFLFSASEELKRRIFGAGNIFLMPSLTEPCGINHMRAARYGLLAVLRETGGLIDTASSLSKKGAAFMFSSFSKDSFMKAIMEALTLYKNPQGWNKMVKIAMSKDFSWRESAEKYDAIYEKLT